ncbi:Pentatricopeptide repeat-containing protein, chloroplastic/mitochondrial [Glycine soja]
MSERNEVSWNIMIDSYAKGGIFDTALRMFGEMQKLEIAKQVFESMAYRDVNSWNSMILDFAMHGEAEAALDYYVRMVKVEKLVPNSITFVDVLSACNHRGMVDKGIVHFDMMTKEYNVEPKLEHYGCLVDLFARAGRIDEALNLVSEMPIKPDAVIWRSLLDACCKQHASVELSEEMAKWNNVGLLRKLMSEKGVTKDSGCNPIEIDGEVHEFVAGDTTDPQSENVYKFVNEIEKLESIGYLPDYLGAPMVDEINDGKQNTLRVHSERLAIAFGFQLSPMFMEIIGHARPPFHDYKIESYLMRSGYVQYTNKFLTMIHCIYKAEFIKVQWRYLKVSLVRVVSAISSIKWR